MPPRDDEDDSDELDLEPDEDVPEDEGEEEEETPPPRSRSSSSRRQKARQTVRPWRISDLDSEEDDLPSRKDKSKKPEQAGGFWQFLRRPVFFRARDSWYFEPLLALAIILLLLVSLYAYTANWPPVYVVESGSMQHGSGDTVGLINTGDLVLVKQIPSSAVVPYVVGEQTGYSTYGEYGDVILYHPNGDAAATPVIHRAIVYLEWEPTTQSYSAPSLAGLPCGTAPGDAYSVAGAPNGCATTGLITTLTLYHVGWRSATVAIPLGVLGHYSGFVTMGDNNVAPGSPAIGEPDQVLGISGLVSGSWIVGAARGMVPWVGAFKLLLDGNAAKVPAQSWQFLALTIAAIVLAGFGIHYLFRVEGIEDPRRLEEEQAEAREREDDEEDGGPRWEDRPRGSRWKGLRAWLSAPDAEEGEEQEAPRPKKHTPGRVRPHPSPSPKTARGRGRPRPAVRKGGGLFHRRPKPEATHDTGEDSL